MKLVYGFDYIGRPNVLVWWINCDRRLRISRRSILSWEVKFQDYCNAIVRIRRCLRSRIEDYGEFWPFSFGISLCRLGLGIISRPVLYVP